MTFLAFDPDRLRALTVRAQVALVELSSLPVDDPAADAAGSAVRSAIRTLELGLLPAVRRVLDAPPRRVPISPLDDLDALPNALARRMATTRGWAVATDPVEDDLRVITPEEVDALALRLRDTEPRDVVDDAMASEWLALQLRAIAADPALCRRFDAQFGRWRPWADLMATRDVMLHRSLAAADGDPDETNRSLHRLDRLVTAFARVVAGTIDVGNHEDRPLVWLDTVMPHAAAMLLAGMRLPAGRFTDLAIRTLRRAPDPLDGIGPSTADIVLGAALAQPDVLPGFARAAIDGTELLTMQLADPHLLAEVLGAATDPTRTDPDTAGRIIVPVLRAAADRRAPMLRDADLADLVAPWTPQFLSAGDEWGLPTNERSRLLRTVVESTEGLERLISRSDALVDGARRAYGSGTTRTESDYVNYLGTMGVILMDQRIRDLTARTRAWDVICNVAGLATSFIPWAALGLVASAAIVVIHNQQTPDVKAAQEASLFMADAALTQAGANAVTALYTTLVDRHEIPSGVGPPPEPDPNSGDTTSANYLGRLLDWLETLPGGGGGKLAWQLYFTFSSFVSGSQVAEHVWWIANGFPGT